MQIKDDGEIQPPLAGPDIADVARPFLIGPIRRDVTVQQVWRDVEGVVTVCLAAGNLIQWIKF